MLDTIIRGGTVVTPMGVGNWDVGILGEKIVVVAVHGAPLPEAQRVIDASGKIVVPGGIEPHIHAASNVQPGIEESVPGVENAGPLEHSLGAIWGGTTTVVDFAPVPNEGDLARGRPRLYVRLAGECVYGLFHPLHLLQLEHARRHLPLWRAGPGGLSEHQDIHYGHEAAGRPHSHQPGGQDGHGTPFRPDDADCRGTTGCWRCTARTTR